MLVKPEILVLMEGKDKREDSLRITRKDASKRRERSGSTHRKNKQFEKRKARAEKLREAD